MPNPGTLTTNKRVTRFLREARAAANLRHPNIVPIYEAGQIDGHHYIASAFIAGQNLASVVADAETGLPFRQAAEIVRQLAEAVSYAHEQGIIHRDIKPANVMLDESGRAHLMDFGLASREDEAEKLTTDGAVLGTPAYMSPEQARGKAEAASDQYSLGVVLYDLLTGETPFEGPPAVVIAQLLNREPESPRKHRPAIPPDLVTIVLKCLKKEPRERYSGCGQLADDLARWLADEPIRARQPRWWETAQRWAKRSALAASLTACLLLVLFLCGSLVSYAAGNARMQAARADAEMAKADAAEKRRDEEKGRIKKETQRFEVATLRRAFADQSASRAEAGLAEANKHLRAKQQSGWKRSRTWIGIETLALQGHTGYVTSVCWSPDGKRILTGSGDNTAKVWDAETDTELLALKGHTSGVSSVSWSPDGKRILTGSGDNTAKVWDAEKGTELLTLKGHTGTVYSVSWSPDGKRILTGGGNPIIPGQPGEAKVWDTDKGTEVLSLQGHTSRVTSVCWSPDGKRILTGSDDWTAKVWDAEKGTEVFALKWHPGGVLSVSWSPDGKRILTGSWDNTAKVWDAEKGTEIPTLEGLYGPVAFSPDGKRILTVSEAGAMLWFLPE